MKYPEESGSPRMLIRPLRFDDIGQAASLHVTAFPGFFLSTLGTQVLREFYRGHLAVPGALSLVAATPQGEIIGVVTGSANPGEFYRRLLRQQPVRLSAAVVRACWNRPKALGRLLRGLRSDEVPSGDLSDAASLSSICVHPGFRGSGIGEQLMTKWLQDIAKMGASRAYLTTDADNNAAVNRWYSTNGWRNVGTFTRPEGRRMNYYAIDLDSSIRRS